MADPKTISASKIAYHRGCPLARAFRYEEIDGKKLEKPPTSPALAFGIKIHYMADQLYKKKQKGEIVVGVPKWETVDKCIGAWKFNWGTVMRDGICRNDTVKFKSEAEKWTYYWAGVHILKGFYNKMVSLPWPEGTEKDYRTEFAGEKVVAKIDRLDIRKENGELKHIISDYKTDRLSPEASTFLLHRSPQFTLYSKIYEQMHGIKPSMQLIHMRTGKAFKTARNQGDYDYLEALVKQVAKSIRNDEILPFFGFHCNMCGYKENACKDYGIGVDGKLKALEEAMKTSPEISDWISFDVEKPQLKLFDKILEKIPKSLGWVRTETEKIFADCIMMKDTIEEIGVDSLEFISAMQEPPEEEELENLEEEKK